MVLWEEYRAVHPDGYGYSRFCDLFREFERRLSPTMRQDHVGRRQGLRRLLRQEDRRSSIRATGEMREAEIFVAVLGASNFTYAEATWTQTLPDWIGAHVRMFRFFGGVPRLVVPDNLKSGVHKASFYDPEINRSYGMMAAHYGVGILPARPRKPRDKAKVESRGPLRPDLYPRPAAPADLLLAGRGQRGDRRARSSASTTTSCAGSASAAASCSRPSSGRSWRRCRMPTTSSPSGAWPASALDYHVEVDGFFYSVPHGLIREQVDVRATSRTIEMFHRGKRVAAHQRRYGGRRHGTDPEHMPSAHRRYAEWTPERFRRWAAVDRAEHRRAGHRHPGQPAASRAGLPHLPRRPAAVTRPRCRTRRSGRGPRRRDRRAHLQEHRLHPRQQARPHGPPHAEDGAVIDHANLRGPGYFH